VTPFQLVLEGVSGFMTGASGAYMAASALKLDQLKFDKNGYISPIDPKTGQQGSGTQIFEQYKGINDYGDKVTLYVSDKPTSISSVRDAMSKIPPEEYKDTMIVSLGHGNKMGETALDQLMKDPNNVLTRYFSKPSADWWTKYILKDGELVPLKSFHDGLRFRAEDFQAIKDFHEKLGSAFPKATQVDGLGFKDYAEMTQYAKTMNAKHVIYAWCYAKNNPNVQAMMHGLAKNPMNVVDAQAHRVGQVACAHIVAHHLTESIARGKRS